MKKSLLALALVAAPVLACPSSYCVRIDFVAESLCPGCESYSTGFLNDAIKSVGEIMDVYSWPYGNAAESKNADGTWKYTCQHGTGECAGNIYQACGIEHNNKTLGDTHNTPAWWAYFLCLEASGNAGSVTVAQNCASKGGLDWNTISTCAGSDPTQGSSTDGNPLMHNIALWTNALVPPHQWTPWVIMDNTPLNQAQLDLSLTTLVCNEYKKKSTAPPPAGCSALNSEKISKRVTPATLD